LGEVRVLLEYFGIIYSKIANEIVSRGDLGLLKVLDNY